MLIHYMKLGGVISNVRDCDIVESEFELQSL